MTTSQLAIVCIFALLAVLAVCAAIVAVAWLKPQPETPSQASAPRRVGHRVTVHTKQPDDKTLFGVIAADYDDQLVLEHAELVTPLGTNPLPGRQHIPSRDISWIDVHALVSDGLAGGAPA